MKKTPSLLAFVVLLVGCNTFADPEFANDVADTGSMPDSALADADTVLDSGGSGGLDAGEDSGQADAGLGDTGDDGGAADAGDAGTGPLLWLEGQPAYPDFVSSELPGLTVCGEGAFDILSTPRLPADLAVGTVVHDQAGSPRETFVVAQVDDDNKLRVQAVDLGGRSAGLIHTSVLNVADTEGPHDASLWTLGPLLLVSYNAADGKTGLIQCSFRRASTECRESVISLNASAAVVGNRAGRFRLYTIEDGGTSVVERRVILDPGPGVDMPATVMTMGAGLSYVTFGIMENDVPTLVAFGDGTYRIARADPNWSDQVPNMAPSTILVSPRAEVLHLQDEVWAVTNDTTGADLRGISYEGTMDDWTWISDEIATDLVDWDIAPLAGGYLEVKSSVVSDVVVVVSTPGEISSPEALSPVGVTAAGPTRIGAAEGVIGLVNHNGGRSNVIPLCLPQ